MYSVKNTVKQWVAPFGDIRIKGCSHLPVSFRRVPRPSSPLVAKASTRCPLVLYSLCACKILHALNSIGISNTRFVFTNQILDYPKTSCHHISMTTLVTLFHIHNISTTPTIFQWRNFFLLMLQAAWWR